MGDSLSIIFLGGLGEIGRNMCLIESQDEAFIIDCGMMFPSPNMHGIRKVTAHINFLDSYTKPIRGVFLTHGHEDHVGGLPFLYQKISAPLYGSPLSLAIAKQKLRYRSLWRSIEFVPIVPKTKVECGEFSITPIHVCHSIPNCFSFLIEHKNGRILHSGDFKLDTDPVDNQPTDLETIEQLSEKGIDILLSDSTNANSKGSSPSESSIYQNLLEKSKPIKGKIIIALFASHVHRVIQCFKLAKELNRNVLVLGAALVDTLKIAQEAGIIPKYEHRITFGQSSQLPDEKLLIITTGSQGEPHSMLTRSVFSRDKGINLKKDDAIIISAKTVPGNEHNVNKILNQLAKRQIKVFDGNKGLFHVSGHGYEKDLLKLLSIVKPKYFIPVHGEYTHLLKHRAIGVESGIDESSIYILENGDSVSLEKGTLTKKTTAIIDQTLLDGAQLYKPTSSIFDERSHLQKHGYLVIIFKDERADKLISKGFVEKGHPVLDEILPYINKFMVKFDSEPEGAFSKHLFNFKPKFEAWLFERAKKRPFLNFSN
ncbi:ribonuclease J [bacterium]|jgi:ribonuclease J|nr:ribonuclease J [bacterium]